MPLEDVLGKIGLGQFFQGGIVMMVLQIGLIALTAILVIGFIFWFVRNKKKWNLKVVFDIPRSDGKIINQEFGRGAYDSKRGVVWLKRAGLRKVAMKPFDIKKFLLGKNNLNVVQKSPEEYIPNLHDSWEEMEDVKTGVTAALINMKTDLSDSRAWRNSFEREAKSTYSIVNILMQYATPIGIGIILFFNFVGFAILYTRVT